MTTNQILVKDEKIVAAAQISFATHATYAPADANLIELVSPTVSIVEVEMAFIDWLDTAAEQSAIADLGLVRAPLYQLSVCMEYQVGAPTTATQIEWYWAATNNATAARGNPGFTTGAVGAYDGGPATLVEGISQLDFIGVLNVTADIEFQIQINCGFLSPATRYGMLIGINKTGATVCDTDVVESAAVLTPIVQDIAAAA